MFIQAVIIIGVGILAGCLVGGGIGMLIGHFWPLGE
jgi:hypothetical protein